MKTDRPHPGDLPGQITTGLRNKKASRLVGIAAIAVLALAACTAPGRPGSTTSSTTSEQISSTVTTPEAASSAETSSSSSSSLDLPLDFQIAVYQGQELLGGVHGGFRTSI